VFVGTALTGKSAIDAGGPWRRPLGPLAALIPADPKTMRSIAAESGRRRWSTGDELARH
jgi:hypothetical protein